MPRFRLTRSLLYLSIGITVLLFTFNINENSGRNKNDARTEPPTEVLILKTEDQEEKEETEASESLMQQDDNNNNVLYEEYPTPRLWFMSNGWVRPEPSPTYRRTGRTTLKLWPHEEDTDRIFNQLMFVPPGYYDDAEAESNNNSSAKLKNIVIYNGIAYWQPLKPGRDVFLKSQCPVDTCEVTGKRSEMENADAVIFRDFFIQPYMFSRPSNQVWILYMLESPYNTPQFPSSAIFNWTATYRHDSDIVTPYEKFIFYDRTMNAEKLKRIPLIKNYAKGKDRQVAWFVSNCVDRNKRLHFAKQLRHYIGVDIYGTCGDHRCPRSKSNECFDLLNEKYKFYLSFENSNCKDYITEKFFVNGLGNDVIPIVMGARREDYERAAPPHSFIHVEDFPTVEALADYLHLLDKNETLYNEYFRWKDTGELINTYFWCRLCALLHDNNMPIKEYTDINRWWRGRGTCSKHRWSDSPHNSNTK